MPTNGVVPKEVFRVTSENYGMLLKKNTALWGSAAPTLGNAAPEYVTPEFCTSQISGPGVETRDALYDCTKNNQT
jgi:hypothetical protein